MATTIVTKSGSGAPTASDLVAGELAVDLTNKRLYTEDSGGTVLEVGSNPYNFTANHDGSAKLATTATGIDVTGSVTADGATVSGQTIISADALVATPSTYYDELVVQNSASGTGAGMTILMNATNGFGGIKFGDSGNSNQFGIGFDASANLGFLDVLGAQALTIDSSRNVGIGTSDANPYSLASTGTTLALDSTSASVGALVSLETAGVKRGYLFGNSENIVLSAVDAAIPLVFNTNDTERLRIDASGAVKINGGVLELGGEGIVSGNIHSQESLYINSDSNGTPEAAPIVFGRGRTGSSGGTEDMRLDGAGNLLVGTTSTTIYNITSGSGIGLFANGSINLAKESTTTTDPALLLNNTGVDGDIAQFRKDGTTVGSIGSLSGIVTEIVLDPRTDGASLTGGTNKISPGNQSGALDAHLDLGSSDTRFKDLYLSGGVYLGGTGAANKLSDFETGTWTPTVTSSAGTITTVTSEIGTYTKIGRLVTLQYQFNIATLGTASGNCIVSGMPFTEDNTEITYYAGVHRARSGASSITEFDPAGTLQLYGTTPVAGVYLGSMVYNTTS
jgi:hypothetical protein